MGTSTNTGLAIGYSIAKHIHDNIGAKTLFATHFHQLNEMETAFTGIKNYHMAVKYEGEDLIFLHKLVPGGTDESHGIEVAQLAGFPIEVIADAKETRALIDQGQFFTKTQSKNSQPKSDKLSTPKPATFKGSKQASLATFIADPKWTELKQLIDGYDLNNMTPMDALQALQELQNRVK